ncbi:MAG: arylsulfotransferase family protein [Solirubrobacteraceae bacterium]
MAERTDAGQFTRRRLLQGAGGAAVVAALGGGVVGASRIWPGRPRKSALGLAARYPPQPVRSFHSRPDLRPASVAISGRSGGPGYLLLGPGSKSGSQSGPLIVDDLGEPVWFKPLPAPLWESNFTTNLYRGEPVLSWWQGEVILPAGYGKGEGVIVDRSYRELRHVGAANGRQMDVHEFRLTAEGTAIFSCFPRTVLMDLSEIGGPRAGRVLESIIQEIDLRSGRLLLEWRSLDHIPISDSYRPLEEPYDYLHLNSIDIAPDGDLLVSARHTWTLYKLDRHTGEVIWRLGGKRSDFAHGSGTRFSWQHDARYIARDTITVFDNGSDGPTKTESQSRALVLDVHTVGWTARVTAAYRHPSPLVTVAMGSVQPLPNGNVLVGWGSQPHISEFTADGSAVSEAVLASGQQSYRAFRLPWKGSPTDVPAIAVHPDETTGNPTIYASWNGATDITHWQVHAGPDRNSLQPIQITARTGFETAITLGAQATYVAVTALDSTARRLASSRPLQT